MTKNAPYLKSLCQKCTIPVLIDYNIHFRTPEIVNSLMAMTDPFKLIRAGAGAGGGVRLANSPPSSNSNSIVAASSSPPSLQHTRTQLIKEGLKLTIQSKRKSSLSVSEEHQPAPAPLAQAVMADRPSRNRTMSEDVSQDSQDYSSGGVSLKPMSTNNIHRSIISASCFVQEQSPEHKAFRKRLISLFF